MQKWWCSTSTCDYVTCCSRNPRISDVVPRLLLSLFVELHVQCVVMVMVRWCAAPFVELIQKLLMADSASWHGVTCADSPPPLSPAPLKGEWWHHMISMWLHLVWWGGGFHLWNSMQEVGDSTPHHVTSHTKLHAKSEEREMSFVVQTIIW